MHTPRPDVAPGVHAGGRLPVVIYAAKSTEDVRGSMETQVADCRAAAEAEGRHVVADYRDEAASAYTGDRGPQLRVALEHVGRLAAENGTAELWVQHSDRLARGDGKTARHVVEVALWALKANVRVRPVQDPDTFRDLLYAVVTGQRNHEDSARKAAATAAGLRRAAERGDWVGGILPDGYRVIRGVDDRGHVTRCVELDPQRSELWRFIWDSAVAGWSVDSIVLELDRRGLMTNPRKAGHRARKFDANRVRQALANPFYAALSVHKGEIVGRGHWPAYVSPDDFRHAADQRSRRSGRDRRGPGRPRRADVEYLLSGLARCGECGLAMPGLTGRGAKNQRADGTFARRYVCQGHGREYPRGHSLYCDVKPIDATLVDTAFAANLDRFLGDVGGWREQLASTREAERQRLERAVDRARTEAAEHERVAAKLRARYDAAIGDGDDEKAEIVLETLAGRRREAERAQARLAASVDALESTIGEEPVDAMLDFFNRLSDELSGRVEQTSGDVRRTNVALREFFDAVELTITEEGVRMLPILSVGAVERILEDPSRWPLGVTAEVHGKRVGVTRTTDGMLTTDATPLALDDLDNLPELDDEVRVTFHVAGPGPVTADPTAPPDTPPLRPILAGGNPHTAS